MSTIDAYDDLAAAIRRYHASLFEAERAGVDTVQALRLTALERENAELRAQLADAQAPRPARFRVVK